MKSATFEVSIAKLTYGGDGLGRHMGKVVFVPFSAPGDRLLVRAVEEKKNFVRARIVRIIEPGPGRSAPVCPYFEKCGGCQWQHIGYERQVAAKRQILEELLHHRFPETHGIPISMRACPRPYGYRSRARMQVRESEPKNVIGFFRCRSHAVEDVDQCPLFTSILNKALDTLRRRVIEGTRFPQEVDLLASEEEDVWTGTAATGESEGKAITKKAGMFKYSVTAAAFFQANDLMTEQLAEIVRSCAKGSGSGLALDLFAGVGLFTIPLAAEFSRVVAVESAPEASRLCAINSAGAGMNNIDPICADVLQYLESDEISPLPDLVVLDPPRTGAGVEVMRRIKELKPRTIVYVSCDPQTLARDLSVVSPGDYRIDMVEGLDMFPQTYHFETFVRLTAGS